MHKRWKPNIEVLKAVIIQYIKATKRFPPRAVVAEETGGMWRTQSIYAQGRAGGRAKPIQLVVLNTRIES
jgi:hypothetical protein